MWKSCLGSTSSMNVVCFRHDSSSPIICQARVSLPAFFPGIPKFLRVLIPKHKNDQPAWLTVESNAMLSRGPNDQVLGSTAFCVPTLFGMYISKAGLTSGYLFGSLSSRSRAQSKQTSRPPAKAFLANAIKRLLTLIGASPTEMTNVTGHSTRRTGTISPFCLQIRARVTLTTRFFCSNSACNPLQCDRCRYSRNCRP